MKIVVLAIESCNKIANIMSWLGCAPEVCHAEKGDGRGRKGNAIVLLCLHPESGGTNFATFELDFPPATVPSPLLSFLEQVNQTDSSGLSASPLPSL